ncbi:MAG: ArsA family ATPase [Oligoflexales bacterium]|nr:ArsA family ATPase [Oligoflexales bacterium]
MTYSSFSEFIRQKKILIVLGAGGVGKTSCSVGLAAKAASMGQRVALLSIDPAKRLAQALGIPLGSELKPVDLSKLVYDSGVQFGRLDACMLDQKIVFDQMVYRYAPSRSIAEKILKDKLYQSASNKLAGSLEYMALAKLQDIVDSQSYDLIVLDTPPDTQALDFLKKPNVLDGFMENNVMTWLVKPFYVASKIGFEKFFKMGEKLMGGLAKITGFGALKTFSEFLILIQNVIEGFHKASERVVKTLLEEKTSFALICTPKESSLQSARSMMEELGRLHYAFDFFIWNKCLPPKIVESFSFVSEEEKNSYSALAHLAERVREENSAKLEMAPYTKGLFCQELYESPQALHEFEALSDFVRMFK